MRRVTMLMFALLAASLVAGCSRMEGLRVLTGQPAEGGQTDLTIEALDLVMADKSGSTDPALVAAADRIEQASGSLDIIEIRQDPAARVFQVNLLWAPPNVDPDTQEGQVAISDSLRRAMELTWQGTMNASRDTDVLQVRILVPQTISTLNSGTNYIGVVVAQAQIDRSDAAAYLAGTRSLATFFDLIVTGALDYITPRDVIIYEGQPNHPMFMLPAEAAQSSSTQQ